MKLTKKILALLFIVVFTVTIAYLPSPVKAFGACADARSSCEAGCSHSSSCLRGCQAAYQDCCNGTQKCRGDEFEPEGPPEN